MNYATQQDVLDFVEDNNVKFVRFAFTDIFGAQKNIAVLAGDLPKALEDGVCFDGSAVPGFMQVEESDLVLRPDLSTLTILPWRPAEGRVMQFFCDIEQPGGRPFGGNCRGFLRQIARRFRQMGLVCNVGAECEFYLFETDEKGFPTLTPFDNAGYFDMAPLDKGENVRREICFALENMGIKPERSHHEHGPGQNEIDFRCSSPLKAADDLMTFKTAVKAIAQLHGLYASFLPKPLENESGNGLHINLSLYEKDRNLFSTEDAKAYSFMAGILRRMNEITAFSNPLVSSYERFGHFEAPSNVSWSHQNRSTLVRIPYAEGHDCRMEVRSPDPAANPYLLISLLLSAGFEGIADELEPEPEAAGDMLSSPLPGRLPSSLSEAVMEAEKSDFIHSVIPQRIAKAFLEDRKAEAEEFERNGNDYEYMIRRYFPFI